MKKIDMSEEAVWRRLRQLDQLHELSLSLLKAGKPYREKLRRAEKEKSRPSPPLNRSVA